MLEQLAQQSGIWRNEKCIQCGACCYDYRQNSLCKYQEIKNGKSYCKCHEDPERDKICQTFFCGVLNNDFNSIQRSSQERTKLRFIRIAFRLGTAPKINQLLNNFSPSTESSTV